MKKITILMMSLLFALSFPLLSMAQEAGEGPMAEQEAAAQPGNQCYDPSSCMEHMRHGRGMEGRHGDFERMGHLLGCRLPKFYLRHAKDLKLSDEQVASLKKISLEFRKDMITKMADVKVKKLELKEILDKPDYKLEDATAKLKECEDARMALATSALQHATQARDVLTPDQLKKVGDLCRDERSCKSCGKGMKRHMGPKR